MTKLGIPNGNRHLSAKEEAEISLEQCDLEKITRENLNSISVIDKFGNILLVFLGVKVGNLVGTNVKDPGVRGMYDWSPCSKAIEQRSAVTGFVSSKYGSKQVVNSTPLLDEKGDVALIIDVALDKDLIDSFLDSLNKGRDIVEQYKTTMEFLNEEESGQMTLVLKSPQMIKVLETCNVIAKTLCTVTIIGESGTGKDVLARHIHQNSLRSKGSFIPVNCAAIPTELLESEFFGYVRGAFTGANSQGKPGLFELADKGTLFLDEIGELPLEMQSKLLRVVETGEIRRVGGTTISQVDVRLIAATNRDLKTMISEKKFRSDLYYRLNVIPVNIPPLRERPEDILALANLFLVEMNRKYSLKKTLSSQVIKEFLNYNWPGNIREMRNVIERLAITTPGNTIYCEADFLENSGHYEVIAKCVPEKDTAYKGTLKSVLKRVEEEYIKEVLLECDGKVGEAAEKLGIHRTMLYRKLKNKQG